MTFRVRIGRIAQQDIDRFAAYAADYSESWAADQFARLGNIFNELAEAPLRRSFFVLTAHPTVHAFSRPAEERTIGSSIWSMKRPNA